MTQQKDPILAAVVFKGDSAMIGVPKFNSEPTFVMKEAGLFTGTGEEIEMPSEEVAQRVKSLFEENPESVFVVEFEGETPVCDYPIKTE